MQQPRDTAVKASLPELIALQADARALRLPAHRPVRQPLAGQRQSPLRGRGMAFAEVRLYQPGDDIRTIDWRVTARRQAPHTKLFEEEKERPLLLVCDLGPSLFFGSVQCYKQVRTAQAAALLAWLGLWQGDQVGGVVFNHQALHMLKPARRRQTVMQLLDLLANHQLEALAGIETSPSRLDDALREVRRIAHTGSRIILLSDFLSLSEDTTSLLATLSAHNSVSALRIQDPLEIRLPESGRFAIKVGHDTLWFNAGDKTLKAAFSEQVRTREAALAKTMQSAGISWLTLGTQDDPAAVVRQLLGTRGALR
ncbi:MAG: DUF58 domain-containing protein [Marinobacter sp.]|nr:DUF58 domain-containing protein [Marinobacter sp.]